MRQYTKSYASDEKAVKLIKEIQDAWTMYTCYKSIIDEILDQDLGPLANKTARLNFYSNKVEESYVNFKHLQETFANKYVCEFKNHDANWTLDYYTYLVKVTVNCTCEIKANSWMEYKER